MPEEPAVPPVVPPAADPLAALKTQFDALQTQFAAEKTAREAAEAKATNLEREKMSEADRVKAELADAQKIAAGLDPLKQQLQTYHTTFENIYKEELAAVPEDKRAAVEALSSRGTPAERVEALRTAKTLVGVTPTGPMGGPLNPGGKPGNDTTPAFTFATAPRIGDLTFKK